MSLLEKVLQIKEGLEQEFNGKVTTSFTQTFEPVVIFTLKLKYTDYIFAYPVAEIAIEQTESSDMIVELISVFTALIWNAFKKGE